MPRKRKAKAARPANSWKGRARRPDKWVSGAIAFLHRASKAERQRGRYEDATALAFAALMIRNCWDIGEPDLYVGMFYTPDWRYWREITAQPKPEPPGLPSEADLDRVAEEERVAIATENAEAQ